MAKNGTSQVLSAADIRRYFSREVVDIVVDLIDKGATVKRTNGGHLVITGTNGEIMGVSRNSGSGRTPIHKVKADALRLQRPAEAPVPDDSDVPTSVSRSDFQGWNHDIRDLCITAVREYGWTFFWRKDSSGYRIVLTSPNGDKTLEFNGHSKPVMPNLQSLKRTILKHGRLLEREAWKVEDQSEAPDPIPEKKQETPVSTAVASVEVPTDIGPTHLVSTKPWLAKRRQGVGTHGTRYESPYVNERTWSDGSIDYECTEPGCDYVSNNPRGVSAHGNRAHRLGQGRQRGEKDSRDRQPGGALLIHDSNYPPPAFHRTYSPRDDRVDALAKFLAGHVDSDDWSVIAKAALVWQHEQKGEHAAEREPMTDAEVLDKIRAMVDNGEYLRQQQELETLKAELATVRDEAQHCRTRADSLADNLGALRELLVGLDIETDGN